MVLDYNRLVQFTNSLAFNNMAERQVTKDCYRWLDSISSDITEDYRFFITYVFNPIGVAINAIIAVEYYKDGEWLTCGEYQASQPITFQNLLCVKNRTPIVSQKESEPINYYRQGYYVQGYYK